ncbi:MAG: histidinol-phosphate transaminase [Euryarchaeota archaeon]|nr:histidinol-phosphate transaminase [Euryarchaeota archaeon]
MLKGVLEILQPYEAGKTIEEISERYNINNIVKLGSNENPYSPPKSVVEEIAKASNFVNRYPDPSYTKLKKKLSEYTGLSVENISLGSGAGEILDSVCKIALNPLDKVVIPVPTYTMYAFLSMLRDASLQFVETLDFEVRAGEVIDSAKDAKLIFLCSPNNPTGRVIERKELIKIIEGTDALVAVDEAYYEFCGETIADKVKEYENLIVVRSMSKFFGLAGLRVGYALSNKKIIEALEKARLPFNISSIAESAAIAALEEMSWFEKIKEEILEERKFVMHEINKLGLNALPSEANFLLVRLPSIDMQKFIEGLYREGVIVRNVTGVQGLKGNYLRITMGKKEENRKLISALRKLMTL